MRVTILVNNRTEVVIARSAELLLPAKVAAEIRRAFEHPNPEYARKRRMRCSTKGEQPTIRTWREEQRGGELLLSLPRGGLSRVRAILKRRKLNCKLVDQRTEGDAELAGKVPSHRLTLYGYQDEGVSASIARQNCVFRAPTGSGKTTCGFAAASRVNLPTLVIVWTGNLFKQWVRRCQRELGLPLDQIGMVWGRKRTIGVVTIAMQQTLSANPRWIEENKHRFGMVICDEVQRFAARTLFDVVDPFPAKFRIGISADETRKDRKEFLIYDLFGEVAADISQERLIKSGHVMEVKIRVVPTGFKAPWYRTRRTGPAWKELLDKMTQNKRRNRMITKIAVGEAKRGNQLIVWSHRVEHCHALDSQLAQEGVLSGLLLGGKKYADRFDETVHGIEEGKLSAGVGTLQAVGQALDIPRLNRGIITTPLAGNIQQFGQARGRVCRVVQGGSKADALLYYLWDRHVYGKRHLENLVRKFKSSVVVLRDGQWIDGKAYLKDLNAKSRGIFA